MTDLLSNIVLGFDITLTLTNVGFCFIGALLGTLIGVLPGIGPVATIAMLLPITFGMEPITALIMLAGIYYGAQYGGSTTAILINLPGEAGSVVTTLDGYKMALKGQAGVALGIAAIASFAAGTASTLFIAVLGPGLAKVASSFASPEYFCLMLLGLIAAVSITRGSLITAIAMVVTGMLLGLVGTDINSGHQRMTLGVSELYDGVGFVALTLGLFGLSEIIFNLVNPENRVVQRTELGGIWPNRRQLAIARAPIIRGTLIGSVLGLLPGGGAVLGSFTAYLTEKRLSKHPERFGEGAIEGVAAPEAANNAGAQTSFVPLLTLGVPSNVVMALMMGAMILHGVQPGPNVVSERPDLFWGIVASMWIGNLMLLVINLPMIGIWVRLLSIPYRILFPLIIVFACIGVYSINYSAFEVLLTALFGVLGYVLLRLGCEPTPLILGFMLGPMMEENLRRSLLIGGGSPAMFLERPICLALLGAGLLVLLLAALPTIRQQRDKVLG